MDYHAWKVWEEVDVYLHIFLTWHTEEVCVQFHAAATLLPGKERPVPIGYDIDGPQNHSGWCGEEKCLLPMTKIYIYQSLCLLFYRNKCWVWLEKILLVGFMKIGLSDTHIVVLLSAIFFCR